MGRRGEDDVVNFRNSEQLLVRVEAEELALFRNVVTDFLEVAVAGFHAVVEEIGECDDFDVLVGDFGVIGDVFGVVSSLWINDVGGGADAVHECASTASTAADDADLYYEVVAARGMDVWTRSAEIAAAPTTAEVWRKLRRETEGVAGLLESVIEVPPDGWGWRYQMGYD